MPNRNKAAGTERIQQPHPFGLIVQGLLDWFTKMPETHWATSLLVAIRPHLVSYLRNVHFRFLKA